MVSVVIPLYNKAKHIQRAVDSVLTQTYADFELIVVDDGSSDGGDKIVRHCAAPRLRLIQQANAGVSAARNRGVQEAAAESIAFLDADDEWRKDFLETVVNLGQRFPEAAIWGTAYVESHAGGRVREMPLDAETRRHRDGLLINFFQFSVRNQQPCNCSSTMVSKAALLQAGGFPANLVRLEDTNTLFRLALRHPVAYCPVPKAVYHLEAENRSDQWLWSGNFPFFADAHASVRQGGVGGKLSSDVEQYLGYMHTYGLYRNWLAGNYRAIRESIRYCKNIKGYRLRCFLWRFPVWIPNLVVRFVWSLQSRLRGRDGKLPPVRSIYRSQAGATG